MGKIAACLGLTQSRAGFPNLLQPFSLHWPLSPSHWTILRNRPLAYSSKDTLREDAGTRARLGCTPGQRGASARDRGGDSEISRQRMA